MILILIEYLLPFSAENGNCSSSYTIRKQLAREKCSYLNQISLRLKNGRCGDPQSWEVTIILIL